MKNNLTLNRIRGALYGVAVGEALGGPLEFMSAEAIKQQHGRVKEMIGGGWLHLEPGEVTDDTQMTMAVARGIVRDPQDPIPHIGQNFVEWYESAPKDIGGTCAHAIEVAMLCGAHTAEEWIRVGERTGAAFGGKNGGNGALMRTIYPAVYYADQKQRHHMTDLIGGMTHYNAESIAICRDYADAVNEAIRGENPTSEVFREMYKPGAAPSGYVVDSWSNAIEAFTQTQTFEDAVVEAVNRGGDADTIGAIAGGLAGAYYELLCR